MPKLKFWLAKNATFAIIERHQLSLPWDHALQLLINEYSTNTDYKPYNLIEELTHRQLFKVSGEWNSEIVIFHQSLSDYIQSIHSRNGFSTQRMGLERALEFDQKVRNLIAQHQTSEPINLQVGAMVIWGSPLSNQSRIQ